jgi:hypothetical protein
MGSDLSQWEAREAAVDPGPGSRSSRRLQPSSHVAPRHWFHWSRCRQRLARRRRRLLTAFSGRDGDGDPEADSHAEAEAEGDASTDEAPCCWVLQAARLGRLLGCQLLRLRYACSRPELLRRYWRFPVERSVRIRQGPRRPGLRNTALGRLGGARVPTSRSAEYRPRPTRRTGGPRHDPPRRPSPACSPLSEPASSCD